ncbi:tyrosine-type recombinase/integrase [Clostridium sp. DJ247]|uniref:tyrosine-type recombinase/integrase n=1 Tax=Clostridium sp. DJ247 TaxID=2726188 RepID=UPI0016250793|nr:tyrosine-type recombinase/integrase [Clostridium sp. DJ247]MBC2580851.1 tyrosine-type recombinase/integrase [Clostridium sp. DJ247]
MYLYRHTFAVNAVKKNVDVFYLQKLLGHSLITTTRQYVQIDTNDLVKKHSEANFLDEYFK